MLGVDVSNHQGIIDNLDWKKAAADGVVFAWCKATEGRTYTDKTFLHNFMGARDAGVKVGAYHYARPDNNNPPEAEADHFLRVVETLDAPLLPVLDFEHDAPAMTGAAMTAWAKRWMDVVEQRYGARPIFYSYPYFIRGQMDGAAALAGEKLWLADYGPNDGKRHPISVKFPRFELVAHQYTSNGRVAGIGGRVDLNSAADLRPLLLKQSSKPKQQGPLPGPKRKPRWFWLALKEFLRRRAGKA